MNLFELLESPKGIVRDATTVKGRWFIIVKNSSVMGFVCVTNNSRLRPLSFRSRIVGYLDGSVEYGFQQMNRGESTAFLYDEIEQSLAQLRVS